MAPEICPNCGAVLARNARVCPECGADERTGWSEDAEADRLDLPRTGNFDYDDFIRSEFGDGRGRGAAPGGRPLWHWVVAMLLLLALIAWWVF